MQEFTTEKFKVHRRALAVAGMHRSGTSAMTRVLAILGAELPNQIMVAQKDNPSGFWEPQRIADLNDEILDALDSEWDDVFAFRPKRYLSNFDGFYLGRAVDLIKEEFSGAELIVLKDPRISVLTTFWNRALQEAGYQTHYVIMVRNPLEVAESLRIRDEFPREKALLLWSGYMTAVERDTRGFSRTFVSYERLLTDWRDVRDVIERHAGVPFPHDTATASVALDRFLDHRLRHHHVTKGDLFSRADVPEHVKTLYRVFSSACEGAEIDYAAVASVEEELRKLDAWMGPLLADIRSRSKTLSNTVAELEQARASAALHAESLAAQLAEEKKLRQTELEDRLRSTEEHNLQSGEFQERLLSVEAARGQLTAELEVKTVELNGLVEALTNADAERKKLAAEADAKACEAASLAHLLAEANAAREQALIDVEEKREQLDQLLQRLRHSDQDKSILEQELEAKSQCIANLRADLAQAQGARDRAKLQAEKKTREILLFSDLLAGANAAREEISLECSEQGQQLEQLNDRLRDSEQSAATLRADLARVHEAHDRARVEIDEKTCEIHLFEKRIKQAELNLRELRRAHEEQREQFTSKLREANRRTARQASAANSARNNLSDIQKELVLSQERLKQLDVEVQHANRDLADAENRSNEYRRLLEERYQELGTLGRAFIEEENRNKKLEQDLIWLREVASRLQSSRRWWHRFLTMAQIRRKQFKDLSTAGLFDVDSYLDNYPDVARARCDPLRHYIVHGMDERRVF